MSRGKSGKPRVLLLHPHGFSARDMQFYVPLLDEFDICAVTPRLQKNRRTYAGIPQIPLVSLDQILGAISPAQFALDKLFRLRSENLYHYFGLEAEFARADIVECLETFHPYCRQAIEAKKRRGFALAFSVHENIAFAHENLAYRRKIKRDAFATGDAFFALCQQGRDALVLEGAPPNKIHLSGAGVDCAVFCPGAPDEAALLLGLAPKRDNEIVLLFAGRLVWEKGVFDCVNALALLRRRCPDRNVCLLLAGDGPEEAKLRDLAARLELENAVRFLGRIERDQMPALYRYADVCLSPSIPTPKWQEQFGCVLVEALACGCPVVATKSGAIAEVTGGLAPLAAPSQPTDLADAIARVAFASHPERREIAQKGRAHVVETYDTRVVAERIASVYRDLLAQKRG